jgi:hypothetical protein
MAFQTSILENGTPSLLCSSLPYRMLHSESENLPRNFVFVKNTAGQMQQRKFAPAQEETIIRAAIDYANLKTASQFTLWSQEVLMRSTDVKTEGEEHDEKVKALLADRRNEMLRALLEKCQKFEKKQSL